MKRSTWLWRLRSNPLRRRSYAVQAWAFLAVGLVGLAGALLAGVSSAQHLADRSTRQRLERHSTQAVLTEDAPESNVGSARVGAWARWSAPDGTDRTGSVRVAIGTTHGTRVTVWTDSQGALVVKPLSPPAARFRADTIGGWVTLAIFTGVLLACGTTAKLIDRRRAAQWAAEWAEAGPQWNHRDA